MRALFWDIETSPVVSAVWGLYDQNIPYSHVLQEWFIICASWRWEGEKKVHSVSISDDHARFQSDHTNDYHVIKTLHEVIGQADVLVAHNGDAFDMKKFQSRALYHGLEPVKPPLTIDTLKEARKVFKFTSNKLDDLGNFLNLGRKIKTPPGLWIEALKGNPTAIKEMVKYNKQDVVLLHDVYMKLRPHIKTPNQNLFNIRPCCPKCGKDSLISQGHRITKTSRSPRYQCKSCGGWSVSSKVTKRSEIT